MSDLSTLTYYLRNIYLQQYIGQFIKLAGEDASEVITDISIGVLETGPAIYTVKVYCITRFNQRIFAKACIFITGIEAAVQVLSKDIEAEITKPLVNFTLP